MIDHLTDLEKSVMLAKLNPDWYVVSKPDYARVCTAARVGPCLFMLTALHNFFTVEDGNPHLMPWAWRVLNYTLEHLGGVAVSFENWLDEQTHQTVQRGVLSQRTRYGPRYWFVFAMPPAEAQRIWLDKILTLAIEAGMIELPDAAGEGE